MSINHFLNKIKSKLDIDKITIVYLFIIIGVGVASFGLGRLSKYDNLYINNNLIKESKVSDNFYNDIKIFNLGNNISTEKSKKKMYVASKNGKLYYGINCSGANKIKEENKVWFADTVDAEKSGYSFSSSCK